MSDSKRTGTAVDRARQAWQEQAVATRTDLRAMGIVGQLRRWDEQASGRRGTAVPTQAYHDALDLASRGVSLEVARDRMTQAVAAIVGLAFAQYAKDAGNPKAS